MNKHALFESKILSLVHINEAHPVPFKIALDLGEILQLSGIKLAILERGKALGRLDDVLDLPPVKLVLRQLAQLLLGHVHATPDAAAEVLPDDPARSFFQVRVADRHVNAAGEGLVEGGHAVGREE